MTKESANAKSVVLRVTSTRWFQALGVIGVFLAVPAFIVSLTPVQEILFDKKPQLTVALKNETSVFDVRRPLAGLVVLYMGRDLTASRQEVVVSSLSIENTGKGSITPASVSELDPVGFRVTGGKIIRVTGLSASSDHLSANARIAIHDNTVVLNSRVIFDEADYIKLDVLIIKDQAAPLRYVPVGKVAGAREIRFANQQGVGTQRGVWAEAFQGRVLAQVIRIFAYFVLGFVILASLAAGFDAVKAAWGRRGEQKKIELAKIWEAKGVGTPEARMLVVACFRYLGTENFHLLNQAMDTLTNVDQLTKEDVDYGSIAVNYEIVSPDSIISYWSGRFMKFWQVLNIAAHLGLYGHASKSALPVLVGAFNSFDTYLSEIDPAQKIRGKLPKPEVDNFRLSLSKPDEIA